MNANKCFFYVEVKDLKEGNSKVFQCNCHRHAGRDISVVVIDGVIREIKV